jgi:hypothetical protein
VRTGRHVVLVRWTRPFPRTGGALRAIEMLFAAIPNGKPPPHPILDRSAGTECGGSCCWPSQFARVARSTIADNQFAYAAVPTHGKSGRH